MTSRNQSLDVLRAVAVMLVIFCHYAYFRIMTAGWVGVGLFFVLSGFLISLCTRRELYHFDPIEGP